MIKQLIRSLLLLVLATAALAGDFSLEKARRIDGFLTRIAARHQPALFLKKAAFSESELNSYLNLVYIRKYAPEVSFIELRLKDKNRVDGSLKVKLAGEKYSAVPQFLRDTEVRFSGKFECSNYHMRFAFSELVINGSRFSPDVLDEAYGAAQFNAKVRRSIFDWFTLLPGLKNVQSSEKTIIFYY
ncbi:MAG: hypothetical protein MUC72_03495 [Acidobacteria bacterium]|jgi:hypothetical protein|nr:hypothetical protein [Acidobacteriota bacterium]